MAEGFSEDDSRSSGVDAGARSDRLLASIREAVSRVEAVRARGTPADAHAAQQQRRMAVEEARDAYLVWGPISDALGMARGSAYQRYRRRPPAR